MKRTVDVRMGAGSSPMVRHRGAAWLTSTEYTQKLAVTRLTLSDLTPIARRAGTPSKLRRPVGAAAAVLRARAELAPP